MSRHQACPVQEGAKLFEVIRELQVEDVAVVYVSHRLKEVEELADTVEVLRDGYHVGQLKDASISRREMVRLMVGRNIRQPLKAARPNPGKVVLAIEGLTLPGKPDAQFSFEVRAGEKVGLGGLVGAGRTALLRALGGIDRPTAGGVCVNGKVVNVRHPHDAVASGIVMAPEDRSRHGLVLEMNTSDNIVMAAQKDHGHTAGWIDRAWEARAARDMRGRLQIRDAKGSVRVLSGGNQQKVVIAKALLCSPQVLLLDEPTRGIDVGAKQEVYTVIDELAAQGMGILFASSDMEELLGLADRIIVIHEGFLRGELCAENMTEQAVMELATGTV